MTRLRGALLRGSVLLLVCCLFGCATTAKNNTILYTIPPGNLQPLSPKNAFSSPLVEVMPLRLPQGLNARGLVIPLTTGAYKISRQHRWASPLEQQMTNRVVNDLRTLLATDNVAVYPGPQFGEARYLIEIDLGTCQWSAGHFSLQGVITISDIPQRTVLRRKSLATTTTIDKTLYSGYVTTISQATSALSAEVAQTLRSVHHDNSTAP